VRAGRHGAQHDDSFYTAENDYGLNGLVAALAARWYMV
jgi:hypothetical protein